VLDAFDDKISLVDIEDSFSDAVSDNENDQTQTEKQRDEAQANVADLKRQLNRLQTATAQADAATTASLAAASPPAHVDLEQTEALADLRCHYDATPEDLPELSGPATPEQITLLANLWHFCRAAPFGQAPAVTFDGIGVPPWFAHRMLGDKVWTGFWGSRSSTISGTNWIPTSMLPIMRHIAESKHDELSQKATEEAEAKIRMETAVREASNRRQRGKPY
jgi:hypothetical protein